MAFVKYLISNIFSKNLHLKLYWLLQFESQSKALQQNFTIVPTWDSNRDFPSEALVKVPAQDSIKLSPESRDNENSSSGLKQRLPKWDLGESFSWKLNQTPPNLSFSNSSNSGIEQRLPKWNFIEGFSFRFDFLLPMPGFAYSSNSGLEQKRPKWNLAESSAWSSTTFKVKLWWKCDLIYPVWSFNQTIPKLGLAATVTRDRKMSS